VCSILRIRSWVLLLIAFPFSFPSILIPYSTSLDYIEKKKLPRMNIESRSFTCSLLTNDFESEDGLWLFVWIRRLNKGLSNYLLYLTNICRRCSRSNPSNKDGMYDVCMLQMSGYRAAGSKKRPMLGICTGTPYVNIK
jgi:hypothetical protein